jgi:hypothetical protein
MPVDQAELEQIARADLEAAQSDFVSSGEQFADSPDQAMPGFSGQPDLLNQILGISPITDQESDFVEGGKKFSDNTTPTLPGFAGQPEVLDRVLSGANPPTVDTKAQDNAVNKVVDSIIQGGGGSTPNTPTNPTSVVPTQASADVTPAKANAYADLDQVIGFNWKKRSKPQAQNVRLDVDRIVNRMRD